MYYPYLRGKQFELLALRELTKSNRLHDYENICPIIEPLKEDFAEKNATIEAMVNCRMPFALILNPYKGDFSIGNDIFATNILKRSKSTNLFKPNNRIPAFLVDKNVKAAKDIINKFQLNDIMLIAQNEVDFEEIKDLLESEVVKYFVLPESKTLFRKLKHLRKKIELILIDDNFPSVKRNNDYRDTKDSKNEDQLFSEEYLFYKEEGYSGFSDYTLITKELADGGALPYVVAIHLTYVGKDDEIRVHHFLSDSNSNGRENIQKKFAEAARKADEFFNRRLDRTSSIDELVQFMKDGHYPGLGSLKKYSIMHHIQLVDSLLRK